MASILGLALGLLAAAPVRAECKLQKLIELPVTMVGTRPTVPVKVNGHEAQFLVDSGAFFSVLSPESAARFGVSGEFLNGTVHGIGGTASLQGATVKEFTLAGFTLKRMPFTISPGAGDGIIGENILGTFDVEYDLGNGVVRLFKPEGCGGQPLAYWSQTPVDVLTIEDTPQLGRYIKAPAYINNRRIRVMFDTGAERSVLTLRAAKAAGVTPQTDGAVSGGTMGGFGPHRIDTWIAPFDSFSVAAEQIQHTKLRIGAIELTDEDMLLGADFFLSHRVYVANSQHKLYFTYNGGPVFRLERSDTGNPPRPAAGPGISPPQPTPQGAAPSDAPADLNAPVDASGFSRRAAAEAARLDYAHAIPDFTRSIELDPANPKTFHDRAMAYLANRQPLPAMADLDQALKLKPDDALTLLVRANLLYRSREPQRAKTDVLAAVDAAAKAGDNDQLQSAAGSLDSMGFFPEALTAYDKLVPAVPKSDPDRLANALNGRCWIRAVLKSDLDKALADCDQALRLKPRTAAYLDSRGHVRLDRGEFDLAIADYDAALRENPRQGTSLYARGIAKAKKGAKAEGDADMAAALKINPRLTQQARRVGLDPPADAPQPPAAGPPPPLPIPPLLPSPKPLAAQPQP